MDTNDKFISFGSHYINFGSLVLFIVNWHKVNDVHVIEWLFTFPMDEFSYYCRHHKALTIATYTHMHTHMCVRCVTPNE